MTPKAPKAQLLLDYEIFFGTKPPKDRISLIKHISKEHILYEIVGLNYRLKPKYQIYIDQSLETQINELMRFTQITESRKLFDAYSKIFGKYTPNKNDYPIIFNRQACLFAIEEIINSDELQTQEDFVMRKLEVWDSILKYLLAVNYEIAHFKQELDSNDVSFESLNTQLLPLNELLIETDPIFTLYRGYCLINHFDNSIFAVEIKKYFLETYGIEPQHFVFNLLDIYMLNSSKEPKYNFLYLVQEGHERHFEKLSVRFPQKETYKLINIRKSPLINVGNLKYLIADSSFLLDKTYSQFLNDFWFDKIKKVKDANGKLKYTIEFYKREFGYFFEKYIAEVVTKSFKNYKYSKLLMFDQLKIIAPKGEIEIADIYLRYNNKILLGQVKSGAIYDNEKFGGSAELLYKNDRNEFFKNFGINQLIESLFRLHTYVKRIDEKFPYGKPYEIYPCLIVNDKALQTQLMGDIMNKRFQELLNFNIKKVTVRPLTVIHVSDLERLEEMLFKNPKQIWKLLKYNQGDKKFTPPFYTSLNKNLINEKYKYPSKISKLFAVLAQKYNPKHE